MKDGLGEAAIERIATSLARTVPGFPEKEFTAHAMAGLEALELKARVQHIIVVLKAHLPADFNTTADLLIRLKGEWISGETGDPLAGFAAWPIIDYAGEYGLGHPDKALDVLKELTSLFSAEFAIRPLINQHFETTFSRLEQWCNDPDEHVRRLVSEGIRPRLPWGSQFPQFIADPAPILQLLEKLKDDPSEYVRRSVANNLNDISKDHPDLIIARCRRWKKSARPEREWIIRHASRTLVKSGHPAVFALLGYTENPELKRLSLELDSADIQLGDTLSFKVKLHSSSPNPQSVVVDYAVHHMKANGKMSPKVFKLKSLKIAPGETVEITKRHAIKRIATRTYYPGKHALEILINGKTFGRVGFTLQVD